MVGLIVVSGLTWVCSIVVVDRNYRGVGAGVGVGEAVHHTHTPQVSVALDQIELHSGTKQGAAF